MYKVIKTILKIIYYIMLLIVSPVIVLASILVCDSWTEVKEDIKDLMEV